MSMMMTKNRIVNQIAEDVAELQKAADNNNGAERLLNEIDTLLKLSIKLGIFQLVAKKTLEIYDSGNSDFGDSNLEEIKLGHMTVVKVKGSKE